MCMAVAEMAAEPSLCAVTASVGTSSSTVSISAWSTRAGQNFEVRRLIEKALAELLPKAGAAGTNGAAQFNFVRGTGPSNPWGAS